MLEFEAQLLCIKGNSARYVSHLISHAVDATDPACALRQVSPRPAVFFSRIGASIALCNSCLSSSSPMVGHFACG